jgi:hypothetical protein
MRVSMFRSTSRPSFETVHTMIVLPIAMFISLQLFQLQTRFTFARKTITGGLVDRNISRANSSEPPHKCILRYRVSFRDGNSVVTSAWHTTSVPSFCKSTKWKTELNIRCCGLCFNFELVTAVVPISKFHHGLIVQLRLTCSCLRCAYALPAPPSPCAPALASFMSQ